MGKHVHVVKFIIPLIVIFAILRLMGVIKLHIPPQYYYFLIIIPLIEISAFTFLIVKLVKTQRSKYPTFWSALRAAFNERLPFRRGKNRETPSAATPEMYEETKG